MAAAAAEVPAGAAAQAAVFRSLGEKYFLDFKNSFSLGAKVARFFPEKFFSAFKC